MQWRGVARNREHGGVGKMSLSHRINKLELKAGYNFRIAYPVLLCASGQKFTECPNSIQIAAVSFWCDGQGIRVNRNPGEAYDAFQSRAADNAKSYFDSIVVLPFDVAWM